MFRLHNPVHQLLAVSGALLSFCSLNAVAAQSLECGAISPEHRVALVELYTSEGCSSCPPADKWLGALSSSDLSADKVVPLALHVDYWDYIGWKDPFANPKFTDRQQVNAVRNRLSSIYTPQVLVDGGDYRQWWSAGNFLERVARINKQSASVRLTLRGNWQPGVEPMASVSTTVEPVDGPNATARETLHVAVFENKLASSVTRGENAGETLRHDAVVRVWMEPVILKGSRGELKQASVRLPVGVKPENMGLAAFVQDIQGDVVQAVSCRFKPVT